MDTTVTLQEAIAAYQNNRPDIAKSSVISIIDRAPRDTEALNVLSIILMNEGQLHEALKTINKAIKLAPKIAKYRNSAGGIHMSIGNIQGAIEAYSSAVEMDPKNADHWANLGTARVSEGKASGAEKAFQEALTLQPDHYQARQNLADLLTRLNRPKDALPHLQAAACNPKRHPETVIHLASTYERLNQLDEAEKALNSIEFSDLPWAYTLRARLMRRRGNPEEGLRHLHSIKPMDIESYHPDIIGNWYHELAMCGDQSGKIKNVFENFITAKNYWRIGDGGKSGSDYLAYVRRIRNQLNDLNDHTQYKVDSEEAPSTIFFVGFPRSGTTLMEAMLVAHPEIISTSEAEFLKPLLDENGHPKVPNPSSSYMDQIKNIDTNPLNSLTILDKLPLNIVYCKAIENIFPKAKLLVALRDPRDVILSCLMQRFQRNPAMRNFDTLEDTITLYEEVMNIWLLSRDTLKMPWLEYRYEDLVTDETKTVSRIINFMGVEHHPLMLNYRISASSREISTPSYHNITEKIYRRAVGRWRNYQKNLEPVIDRLAPFVEALGYPTN